MSGFASADIDRVHVIIILFAEVNRFSSQVTN